MKFEIVINTENGEIDIMKSGYNIIAETIYNEELTETIKNLIQNELCEDLASLIKLHKD